MSYYKTRSASSGKPRVYYLPKRRLHPPAPYLPFAASPMSDSTICASTLLSSMTSPHHDCTAWM